MYIKVDMGIISMFIFRWIAQAVYVLALGKIQGKGKELYISLLTHRYSSMYLLKILSICI